MTNATRTDSKVYECICGRAILRTASQQALNLNGTPHVCGAAHAVKPATQGYNLRRTR